MSIRALKCDGALHASQRKRNDHSAAVDELLLPRRWQISGGDGHNDAVVGAMLRPAEAAVGADDRHLGEAGRDQLRAGATGEFAIDLDGRNGS